MAVNTGRTSVADSTATLKAGDAAPDFSLAMHNGDGPWTLSDQRGKLIVLAFFPFAFTPT
jgi:peroxiredoxin